MNDWYELIGQTPVRVEGDVLEWARRYEAMDRRVAHTVLFDMCRVSTVFLGLDHSFGLGPPVLFETMAFWRSGHGEEQMRCCTWLEAQQQHAQMCAEVVRPASVLAYIGRTLRNACDRALTDLVRRWKDLRGLELTDMEKLVQSIEEREGW